MEVRLAPRQFYSITVTDESHRHQHHGSYSVFTDTYRYDLNEVLLHDHPLVNPLDRRLFALFAAMGTAAGWILKMLMKGGIIFSWSSLKWSAIGAFAGFLVWAFNSDRIIKFQIAKRERRARGMSTKIHIVDLNKWKPFLNSLQKNADGRVPSP